MPLTATRPPIWLWIWAILTISSLLLRPAMPLDETRYLAVAWEMWWRGSYAVPYLNGEYYAGKAPLYFWLMHLGWWVTGVNDWWPRLVSSLFGLGNLVMVRAIAARLWPAHSAVQTAPFILLGSFYWALFCTSIMFDMLLGFFASWSVYACIRAQQEGRARHFVMAGIALGFGILTKGPVVFLPALFVVLLAPFWAGTRGGADIRWRRWYGSSLAAVGVAALMSLAWLVPLALGSDIDYLKNITLRQTGGYITESFAHRRPLWWYLPLLPLLLFPWSCWPRAWNALATVRKTHDPGLRLCGVWAVAVLIAFSLISGKQAHYPLLMFPAVALLLARLVPEGKLGKDRFWWCPAAAFIVVGSILFAAGAGVIRPTTAAWFEEAPRRIFFAAGAALIGIGLIAGIVGWFRIDARIALYSGATSAAIVVLSWCMIRASGSAYDVRAASEFIARIESQGAALGIAGTYSGQFNFVGRITSRIEPTFGAPAGWAARHPNGYLIAFYESDRWPPKGQPSPAFAGLYRSGGIAVWRSGDIILHPEIVNEFK